MKAAAVIPARYGATRFRGKPLALIAGRPMITYVIRACQGCPDLNEVIVATDHEEIAAVAQAVGATVMLTGECASGTDRVAQVAAQRPDIGIIVNVQADEPLMTSQVIRAVLEPLLTDAQTEVTTAARQFNSNEDVSDPNRVKVVLNAKNDALYFSRSLIPYPRQPGLEPLLHIGIYGFRRAMLLQYASWPVSALEKTEQLEQLRLLYHGIALRVVRVDWQGIAVDHPGDITLVEECLKSGKL